MDMNELLRRRQVSLMRAKAAACAPSRLGHEGLARAYGARISALHGGLTAHTTYRQETILCLVR